jgi:hypothetical protein
MLPSVFIVEGKELKKSELFGIGYFCILLGIIAFMLISIAPPLSPKTENRLFTDSDGQVEVSLVNTERTLFGDETNIYVSVRDAENWSDAHKIASDGRLMDSDRYVMFVSDDRQWVRACKPLKNSRLGTLAWISGEAQRKAQWEEQAELWNNFELEYKDDGVERQDGWSIVDPPAGETVYEYSLRCEAYINYRANVLISRIRTFSTPEQRDSLLFAFKQADDREDLIDGKRILWEPMSATSSD